MTGLKIIHFFFSEQCYPGTTCSSIDINPGHLKITFIYQLSATHYVDIQIKYEHRGSAEQQLDTTKRY